MCLCAHSFVCVHEKYSKGKQEINDQKKRFGKTKIQIHRKRKMWQMKEEAYENISP